MYVNLSNFLGGRSIQDECNDYVKKNRPLMEGQVYLSAAGNLKCKGVIHAVGPVWRNKRESDYLREAVFKSLEVTSERNYTSIAFPALCAGGFGYPITEATKVIVDAVRDFFIENPGSSVEAVYLCDLNEHAVNGFVTAMKRKMNNVMLKSHGQYDQWTDDHAPDLASKIFNDGLFIAIFQRYCQFDKDKASRIAFDNSSPVADLFFRAII